VRLIACKLICNQEKPGIFQALSCLMANHVHLLVTPESPDEGLGQRYVQYVNRTYRRSGTLWEGRLRSCLMKAEAYVLACYRYIEMNPIRAGMVEHPYSWSSAD